MRQPRALFTKVMAFWLALAPMRPLSADPCGMVPPIHALSQAIQRIGVQKTYVFYRDGLETLVIRPGFTGTVDEFGMLIPFPSPPSVRKVPDDVFEQVAAAIDPPEVVVDLRPVAADEFFLGASSAPASGGLALRRDAVRVLREEAVGMYEVAVLEAGSAKALQRWMEQHGYRYPKGMDKACEDYVAQGWCFVAVKTRVGSMTAVTPRPGMRDVDPAKPAGAAFDGYVQAMGFRFRVDDLVVPMRLSTFNGGDSRNIVYLLTDRPSRIANLPETLVKRQIPGWKLLQNLTQPLPLRVIGGTVDQLTPDRLQALAKQQDPVPHNGVAKELFASDLEAARRRVLVHASEESEKRLLRIGEELGLRGPEIDALIAAELQRQRQAEDSAWRDDLARMTMTVLDGDFTREVLARENLTFAPYEMPGERNLPGLYDAKVMGPEVRRGGVVAFTDRLVRTPPTWPVLALLALSVVVLAAFVRRRRRFAGVLLLGAVLVPTGGVAAQEPATSTSTDLIAQLADEERAPAAVEALVRQGVRAVPDLTRVAHRGSDLEARGWALVALGRIGGEAVDGQLRLVQGDDAVPALVRTWAAAARVQAARTVAAVLAQQPSTQQFPAVRRPFGLRLVALLRAESDTDWVEDVLAVAARDASLQPSLLPAVVGAGAAPLVRALTRGRDVQVRRMAAAFLASLAAQSYATTAASFVEALRFDVEAKDVPWHGGALFVPALAWQRDEARALAGSLVRWHLWCERNGRRDEQKQIHNNLRSLQLAQAAGYASPGWQDVGTDRWLAVWGQAVGRDALRELLREQGVDGEPRYRRIVEALR